MDYNRFFDNSGLDHIGLNILSYLDPSSLAQCHLVAKSWSNLIIDNKFLWIAKLDSFKRKTIQSEKRPRVDRNIKRWKFWQPLIQTFKNDEKNRAHYLKQLYFFLEEGFPFKEDLANFRNAYEPFTDDDIVNETYWALDQNVQGHGEELFNIILPNLPWAQDLSEACYQSAVKGLPYLLEVLLAKAAAEGVDVFSKIKSQPEKSTFFQKVLLDPKAKGQTLEVLKIILQRMHWRDELITADSIPSEREWGFQSRVKSIGSLCNLVLPRYKKRFYKDGILSERSVRSHDDDSSLRQVKNLTSLHLSCCGGTGNRRYKDRFWECFPDEDLKQAKTVALILEQTAIDVNAQDNVGRTALHYAVQFYDTAMVSLLLSHPNIAIDIEDAHGHTPFAYACAYGKLSIVKLLYEIDQKLATKVNEKDDNMTPLHYALFWKTSNYDALEFLLSLPGINVNAKTRKYGHTPLHLACNMTYRKDYSLAKLLLLEAEGIDINARGADGVTTPLDIAKMTLTNLKTFQKDSELEATKALEDKFTTFLRDRGAESNPISPAALVYETRDGGFKIQYGQEVMDDDTDEEMVEQEVMDDDNDEEMVELDF